MLVIQMPDNEQRKAKRWRRKRRAAGYFIAGCIIMYALLDSWAKGGLAWYAVLAVESWWMWACWSDPVMNAR